MSTLLLAVGVRSVYANAEHCKPWVGGVSASMPTAVNLVIQCQPDSFHVGQSCKCVSLLGGFDMRGLKKARSSITIYVWISIATNGLSSMSLISMNLLMAASMAIHDSHGYL